EFCHAEAQQLQQKPTNAENIQWVLVSYAAQDSLNKFAETFVGLATRMLAKITAITAIQYLNIFVFNRKMNAIII
ncbi:MAG: hypothetical protein LBV47_07210, partial [Bacteroidales bacterium]|nr:hypothetical protein [Bacteroidales bacterium]